MGYKREEKRRKEREEKKRKEKEDAKKEKKRIKMRVQGAGMGKSINAPRVHVLSTATLATVTSITVFACVCVGVS